MSKENLQLRKPKARVTPGSLIVEITVVKKDRGKVALSHARCTLSSSKAFFEI